MKRRDSPQKRHARRRRRNGLPQTLPARLSSTRSETTADTLNVSLEQMKAVEETAQGPPRGAGREQA